MTKFCSDAKKELNVNWGRNEGFLVSYILREVHDCTCACLAQSQFRKIFDQKDIMTGTQIDQNVVKDLSQ